MRIHHTTALEAVQVLKREFPQATIGKTARPSLGHTNFDHAMRLHFQRAGAAAFVADHPDVGKLWIYVGPAGKICCRSKPGLPPAHFVGR